MRDLILLVQAYSVSTQSLITTKIIIPGGIYLHVQ